MESGPINGSLCEEKQIRRSTRKRFSMRKRFMPERIGTLVGQVIMKTLCLPTWLLSNLFLFCDFLRDLGPVSPNSPNILMKTFAFVPAPRLLPVKTETGYFNAEKM